MPRAGLPLALAAVLAGALGAEAAEPRPLREREPEGRLGPQRSSLRGGLVAPGPRVAPEAGPKTASARPMCLGAAAPARASRAVVSRLESLAGDDALDPVLWLEAWTETASLPLGAHPTLSLRASHGGWLTVFWLGPDGALLTPVAGAWLPGGRDVELALHATVTTPLGRERLWAVLSPERAPVACGAPPSSLLAWLSARERGLIAVARWEVVSTRLASAGRTRGVASEARDW